MQTHRCANRCNEDVTQPQLQPDSGARCVCGRRTTRAARAAAQACPRSRPGGHASQAVATLFGSNPFNTGGRGSGAALHFAAIPGGHRRRRAGKAQSHCWEMRNAVEPTASQVAFAVRSRSVPDCSCDRCAANYGVARRVLADREGAERITVSLSGFRERGSCPRVSLHKHANATRVTGSPC
jgi:hypothetical protein